MDGHRCMYRYLEVYESMGCFFAHILVVYGGIWMYLGVYTDIWKSIRVWDACGLGRVTGSVNGGGR